MVLLLILLRTPIPPYFLLSPTGSKLREGPERRLGAEMKRRAEGNSNVKGNGNGEEGAGNAPILFKASKVIYIEKREKKWKITPTS